MTGEDLCGFDDGTDDSTFSTSYLSYQDEACAVANPRRVSLDMAMPDEGIYATQETISPGLSQLGKTADGKSYSFLKVQATGKLLGIIDVLKKYPHLQHVDISKNVITDLSIMSKLKYLLYLHAAHNRIESLLQFTGPVRLLEADLSHNRIRVMQDISHHEFLQKLCLDSNQISEISGLQDLQSLKVLTLSNNQISRVSGLDGLPLAELSLEGNLLTSANGLSKLHALQVLNLNHNQLIHLDGLAELPVLSSLHIEHNQLATMDALTTPLKALPALRGLYTEGNPLWSSDDYRLRVIYRLPHLTELDFHQVRAQEKVGAANFHRQDEAQLCEIRRKHSVTLTDRERQQELMHLYRLQYSAAFGPQPESSVLIHSNQSLSEVVDIGISASP